MRKRTVFLILLGVLIGDGGKNLREPVAFHYHDQGFSASSFDEATQRAISQFMIKQLREVDYQGIERATR